MDKKLTLSLNASIIDQAKEYAKDNGVSLSRMIENYLASVVKKEGGVEEEFTPLVNRLMGVIELPKDFDYKSDYTDYLTDKYA